jgi:hypothetical protein
MVDAEGIEPSTRRLRDRHPPFSALLRIALYCLISMACGSPHEHEQWRDYSELPAILKECPYKSPYSRRFARPQAHPVLRQMEAAQTLARSGCWLERRRLKRAAHGKRSYSGLKPICRDGLRRGVTCSGERRPAFLVSLLLGWVLRLGRSIVAPGLRKIDGNTASWSKRWTM